MIRPRAPVRSPREACLIIKADSSAVHNREGLSFKDITRSLFDYDLWILYLIGLTTFIAPGTVSAYFTLTLKSLGFSTFQTNLLTIPSSVLFILVSPTAYFKESVADHLFDRTISLWVSRRNASTSAPLSPRSVHGGSSFCWSCSSSFRITSTTGPR